MKYLDSAEQKKMKRMNIVASSIIVGIAIITFVWLIPNFVPSNHDVGDLSPNLMPFLSMSVCLLCAVLLIITTWRKKNYEASQDDKLNESLVFGIQEAGNLMLWLIASAIIWLLLKFFGFEVAAGLTIAVGAFYGGVRNPVVLVVIALIIPQIIDKVAWYGLQIQLP